MTGSDSAGTSRNQVASGLRKVVKWGLAESGDTNLDFGGGRYDRGTEYLKSFGIRNLVLDPFNRSEEHNRATVAFLMANPADSATILNVLNVIPTREERLQVIYDTFQLVQPYAPVLVQTYTKNGNGRLERTKDGWQMNCKLEFYADEIEKSFSEIRVHRVEKYLVLTRKHVEHSMFN